MQRMLLIDTCGTLGSIAIAELPSRSQDCVPHLLDQRNLPGRETQERLMQALEDMLQTCSLTPLDLDVLAVVTGPGSFTGVRIGLAAVKGLAEAIGKPVVAISRLAVLAGQAQSAGLVQAWIDAGRGDVYVGWYRDGACISELMMHRTEASAVLDGSATAVVMEPQLTEFEPRLRLVPEVGFREVLPLAVAAAQAGAFADPAFLDANYLRVPDAELVRLAAAARQGSIVA